MSHILVVCTANICRSPVAEVWLRMRLGEQKETESWTASSAGTWAMDANPAAPYSVELMAERGLDLSQHESQIVNRALMAQADLVLCMEMGHVEALRIEFPQHSQKIFLISQMVGKRFNVADPYGGSKEDYEQMILTLTKLIDAGIPTILAKTKENAQKREN